MIQEDLRVRYFEWIYKLVCGSEKYNNISYRKLLQCLNEIEFTWIIDQDLNRAKDGIGFRYRFGYEVGYSNAIIERYLDNGPCSVLEMIISLAFRVEEQITEDDIYGNRTGQWFWNMIVNLGLGNMSDDHFDEKKIYFIINKFLNREYTSNGIGGLFTLNNNPEDLRYVEIWVQFMWYLNENVFN